MNFLASFLLPTLMSLSKKVRLLMSIMDKLKEYKKKIRKFQDSHDESFDHLDQMNDTVLIECTHILVFNQKDNNRLVMRVFLCKREINNGNLQVLNCLDSLSFDPSLSDKSEHVCCNIYESSKLLRDCIGGSLFPYKLVNWVAHQVCATEQLHEFILVEKSTWLLSDDEKHWSTEVLKTKYQEVKIFVLKPCMFIFLSIIRNFLKIGIKTKTIYPSSWSTIISGLF